jgi:hypothetical protein
VIEKLDLLGRLALAPRISCPLFSPPAPDFVDEINAHLFHILDGSQIRTEQIRAEQIRIKWLPVVKRPKSAKRGQGLSSRCLASIEGSPRNRKTQHNGPYRPLARMPPVTLLQTSSRLEKASCLFVSARLFAKPCKPPGSDHRCKDEIGGDQEEYTQFYEEPFCVRQSTHQTHSSIYSPNAFVNLLTKRIMNT